MSTLWPLTRKWPWLTSWRACPAGAGEAGAVDDVVQPRLEDLQQVVTGLALATHCLLVVATELLLQHAVAVLGLLLLLQLQEVLALLDARAAVLAGRVRTTLEGGVTADEVDVEATRDARRGSGVTSHRSQTRRRFGGRQPLCGCGVTSEMVPTSRPVACSERIAVSRPNRDP